MINKYLSDKIKLLSFVLILIIVLLHSQMINISSGLNLYIQQFFNLGITRIGVPMFFMISGFLFFQNANDKLDTLFWKHKILSRIRSLLIPFILWTLIGICFVRLALPIHAFTSYFENISIENSFIYDFFYSFINPYKVVYQLWFVRDLFVMVLLSPLIYVMIKRIPVIYFLLLEIFYIHFLSVINVSSIMSFSIGVLIALHYKNILYKSVDSKTSLFLVILWLFLCGIIVYLEPMLNTYQFIYFQQFIIYIGIMSIWLLYDKLYKYMPEKILKSPILSMSFWIFLTHEPVLTVIKKLMLKFIGNDNTSILFIYIIAPIITVLLVLFIGKLMRKYLKPIYFILVGGRV